mmetsp:Transcript_12876/g.28059  ORF Transcript_12876/g.28059 Transcript_12876/m.28059 type:complete len:221 (-) Transcript_12876:963-1625(-)
MVSSSKTGGGPSASASSPLATRLPMSAFSAISVSSQGHVSMQASPISVMPQFSSVFSSAEMSSPSILSHRHFLKVPECVSYSPSLSTQYEFTGIWVGMYVPHSVGERVGLSPSSSKVISFPGTGGDISMSFLTTDPSLSLTQSLYPAQLAPHIIPNSVLGTSGVPQFKFFLMGAVCGSSSIHSHIRGVSPLLMNSPELSLHMFPIDTSLSAVYSGSALRR